MFCNTEEEDKKVKKGPLEKLKVKNKFIINNLEKDNRSKNLLMKRLEEDQIKYRKGGYFFITEENEEENIIDKNKNKDKKNTVNKSADIEQENLLKQQNDNEPILNKPGYESQRNILIK